MKRCVDWDRETRPAGAKQVLAELCAVYEESFGEASLYAELPEISALADDLNNRAFVGNGPRWDGPRMRRRRGKQRWKRMLYMRNRFTTTDCIGGGMRRRRMRNWCGAASTDRK